MSASIKLLISFTNEWWKRLIIFLLLFFSFYKLLDLLIYATSTNLPVYSILLTLIILIPSFFIEQIRPNSKWYYLGFFFDKETNNNLYVLTIITFLSFILYSMILLILGADIQLSSNINYAMLIITIVNLFFLAFSEELLFRGIIFQSLMERYGEISATLTISIIFTLLHIFNTYITFTAILNIFLASILFSFIFIKTRSLVIVGFYHFSWNFFQVMILGAPVSGNYFANSIFTFDTGNMPELLSGGNFGPEASLLLTLFLLVHGYYFNKYLKISPFVSSLLLKREFLSN